MTKPIVEMNCAIVNRYCSADGKQHVRLIALAQPPTTVIHVLATEPCEDEFGKLQNVLARPLDHSKWPPKVREAFHFERLQYLGDLCTITEKALRRHPGIASRTIRRVADFLDKNQLSLGMTLPWWETYRSRFAVNGDA
jgi:hypothetical protein